MDCQEDVWRFVGRRREDEGKFPDINHNPMV
jgi:hypothetical protein